MDFRALGPLQVTVHGRVVDLGGRKPRLVLAALLLEANRVVSADRLIDLIWGDEPPETARSTLQAYISRLRRALGAERITSIPPGYVLRADADEVDATRFVQAVASAREQMDTDPAAAAAQLDEAFAMWRGSPFADLDDEPAMVGEIRRLDELRLVAREARAEAALALGQHLSLVAELEELLAAHPLRERLWGALMLALYRSGRQAEALAAYHRARRLLDDELGIDPSPELQRLQEQILRQDPALALGGRRLHGYQLLERIGEGPLGVVHRALQPQLGREVAVKAIHRRLANRPEFVRRFERDALRVARLEHPHILPLHDYWRDPDGTYLVMPYLRGGSLKARLARGMPLDDGLVLAIIDQVAAALDAAHRAGVVHGRLGPTNILLDDDGNAYVTDFTLGDEGLADGPRARRTDVRALGLLAAAMLAGDQPLLEPRPDLQLASAVIDRVTDTDPARPYPSAGAFAVELRSSMSPTSQTSQEPGPEARNPYKGLRAFEETDAADFFGREALVDRLIARVTAPDRSARFLAVVGPSGSGKSSAVLAGLLPALQDRATESGPGWFVTTMHPGADPFDALAAALLRIATSRQPRLRDQLAAEPTGLVRAVQRILPPGASLLLVIDQLEELFTLVAGDERRAAFLESIAVAAREPDAGISILVTLRADFYDRPLSHAAVAELVAANTETVGAMSAADLERAIVRPLERSGTRIEPDALAAIQADVQRQPGALPLLQYALTELFDASQGATLSLDAYRATGGMRGALVRRAEALFSGLDGSEREAARQLFLRLVSIGEQGSDDTRARVSVADLGSAGRNALDRVVARFGEHRLLTFDRDPVTRTPTVEMAHEALLAEWPRLREWVDLARDDLRQLRRLSDAARQWDEAGRDASFLLRGHRLDQVSGIDAAGSITLSPLERAYVDASCQATSAELEAEDDRRRSEALLQRRAVRRLRAFVAVLLVGVIVAGSLAAVAIDRGRVADRSATLARARELAAAAVAAVDTDPRDAIRLALLAADATRPLDGSVLPEAQEALHLALQADRLVLDLPGYGGRFVGNGDIVAVGLAPGHPEPTPITQYAADGRVLGSLEVSGNGSYDFSTDGRWLAIEDWYGGPLQVWDLRARRLVHEIPDAQRPAFSADGHYLAVSQPSTDLASGVTIIYETAGWQAEGPGLRTSGAVAFAPNGLELAVGPIDEVRPVGVAGYIGDWRLPEVNETGHHVVLTAPEALTDGIAWSPDGHLVAVLREMSLTLYDPTAKMLNPRSGAIEIEPLAILDPPGGRFTALALGPGGLLAAGLNDGTGRVWRVDDGSVTLVAVVAGHDGPVLTAAISRDGTRLLTGGLDGRTKVWDVTTTAGGEWLTLEVDAWCVALSPDGRFLASGDDDGVLRVHDAESGALLAARNAHTGRIWQVGFDTAGDWLLSAGEDGTVRIWATDAWSLEGAIRDLGHVWDAEFGPDADSVGTASWPGEPARLWRVPEGRLITGFVTGQPTDAAFPQAIAFSRDGTRVASVQFSSASIWDVDSPEVAITVPHRQVTAMGFDATGRLVTGGLDGSIRRWDTQGREVGDARQHNLGSMLDLQVAPDGRLMATASSDGTIRLWDADTLTPLAIIAQSAAGRIGFSADGRRLAYAASDGTVRILAVAIEDLVELGRERIGQ